MYKHFTLAKEGAIYWKLEILADRYGRKVAEVRLTNGTLAIFCHFQQSKP
ncbi:MAG: hypothetical protein WBB28_23930 [Crinalium sp.]